MGFAESGRIQRPLDSSLVPSKISLSRKYTLQVVLSNVTLAPWLQNCLMDMSEE